MYCWNGGQSVPKEGQLTSWLEASLADIILRELISQKAMLSAICKPGNLILLRGKTHVKETHKGMKQNQAKPGTRCLCPLSCISPFYRQTRKRQGTPGKQQVSMDSVRKSSNQKKAATGLHRQPSASNLTTLHPLSDSGGLSKLPSKASFSLCALNPTPLATQRLPLTFTLSTKNLFSLLHHSYQYTNMLLFISL